MDYNNNNIAIILPIEHVFNSTRMEKLESIKNIRSLFATDHDNVVLIMQLICHYKRACPLGLNVKNILSLLTNYTGDNLHKNRTNIMRMLNTMAMVKLLEFHLDDKSFDITPLGYDYLWEDSRYSF